MNSKETPLPIDPQVCIGHVHLKVADLERALEFYCGVLGFELMQRYGSQAAFVSAGGYHHHVGLNTGESLGWSPPLGTTGLYHTAILYPTRRAMAGALRRVLDAGCEESGQRQEYLELIAKENERLSRLLDNFLAFSRLERNKPLWQFTTIDPRAVIDAALATHREKFTAPGCRLDIELAPGLPSVIGDADALTSVLINLLDNAYKYTGSEKQVNLRAYASNGCVSIEVRDNGLGVSRRVARKIFDRFYQADRSLSRRAGGCGLGLSIVRLIVRAYGGKVSVDSQPGRGSTFKVTLPSK